MLGVKSGKHKKMKFTHSCQLLSLLKYICSSYFI